ncbi:MAG TPA: hypothetical protein DCM59_11435 [Clostridium sp.]|nr:hypothetical protein [Clostridium sp.]
MGNKTMSKKAKIIVSVVTVAGITGGIFTYYKAEENHKIEIQVATMKEQEKSAEDRVGKLVLGDKAKEYENLINEYNTSIEYKDFNKAENINKKINDFITNLEESNLSELDSKIGNFKELDISKLDDNTKKDIETKLALIENLKSNKDFKSAFQEIDGLTDSTNKLIQEKAEEEKRQEEAKKKEEEANKEEAKNNPSNTSENDEKKPSESNNNDNVTDSSNGGDSSYSRGGGSYNPYENGSVESFIVQSPTAQYTDQIIGVVASGSSAQVYLLEKNNGVWQTVLQTSGFVGSQGVGQASEYASRTPKGSYSLGFAFGTGGNPGTNLTYRPITNNSYWISDVNSPYYNTWQEGDFGGNGNEHLAGYTDEYRYAITLNYNAGVGNGSAFFLHCSNGSPTAGCISVPTDVMLTFMQRIHSGAHIINVNSLSELANY